MRITPRETATILAALDAWTDELAEGLKWIEEGHNFSDHSPLTRDEVENLRMRLKKAVRHNHVSESWLSEVPTYVGNQSLITGSRVESVDFSEPYVPILSYEEDGIRILLGTHDPDDDSKPDLKIERRPHGWAFFFHPNASDPVAMIYLLDDGRSYLTRDLFADPALQLVDEIPSDIDAP